MSDEIEIPQEPESMIEIEIPRMNGSGLKLIAGGREDTPRPSDFFDGDGLLVAKLAGLIRDEAHIKVGHDGRLYRYESGVYLPDGDNFVRVRVRELLGTRYRSRHSIECIAWNHAHHPEIGDRPPEGVLNLANGLLDWRTGVLREHTPDVLSTVQLPVAWNVDAECPAIERFITDVIPEDAISFVIEVVGYMLYAANPLRVAVLLLGPGRNGKSVLLAILKALLGPHNVSSVPLQLLADHRFAAAELYMKLANICGDLDARAIKQTDLFKMLTGGDAIFAERKHAHPFSFVPFALPIFSANEAPISSDQTEAWFDRWLVVPMERRISEEEIDPHLVQKLTTSDELEGLLVLAVTSLRRLMDRGRFNLPESIQAARREYRERLDTTAAFVQESCTLNVDLWMPRAELYMAYRQWCQRSGRPPVSSTQFYARLLSAHADRIGERKRGVKGFLGIGLAEAR